MKRLVVSSLAIWVAATPACAGVGPSARELAAAIAAHSPGVPPPAVRGVRCASLAEEPTEFACRWRQRSTRGRWVRWSTYVAIDGQGYHLIDDSNVMRGGRQRR